MTALATDLSCQRGHRAVPLTVPCLENLAGHPDGWFTLVAVRALGLGIGLNATVFTFANGVLIQGLPFHDPGEILHINGKNTSNGNGSGISHLTCGGRWSARAIT